MFPPQNHKKNMRVLRFKPTGLNPSSKLGVTCVATSFRTSNSSSRSFEFWRYFRNRNGRSNWKASALTMWLHGLRLWAFFFRERHRHLKHHQTSKDINSDFGTGFSSTSYWTTNGVQRVKATRSTLILLPPQLWVRRKNILTNTKWNEMIWNMSKNQ